MCYYSLSIRRNTARSPEAERTRTTTSTTPEWMTLLYVGRCAPTLSTLLLQLRARGLMLTRSKRGSGGRSRRNSVSRFSSIPLTFLAVSAHILGMACRCSTAEPQASRGADPCVLSIGAESRSQLAAQPRPSAAPLPASQSSPARVRSRGAPPSTRPLDARLRQLLVGSARARTQR